MNKLLTVFVISLIYFNLKSLLSNLYVSISNIMDTHVLVCECTTTISQPIVGTCTVTAPTWSFEKV